MRWIRFAVAALLAMGLIWVLNRPIATEQPIPPLGKLLDPFGGFWRNAEAETPFASEETLDLPGVRSEVTVLMDERLVPHVFAQNDHDLYYAQGYLTARLRLWQMDFATRAAGGMLSEVLGARALAFDRDQRRNGMLLAAERALAEAKKDSATYAAIEAYTAGVNAYVRQLSPADYPLEYKLADYAPSEWTPLRSTLLLKYMAKDLSHYANDWQMSHVLARLGPEQTQRFFPDYPEIMDPVIPADTKWDFQPLPVPPQPDSMLAYAADTSLGRFALGKLAPRRGIGSNNWAVAGSKTASGFPILANDPHLALNLPSIWIEMQLVSPGVNVYGVTLPGAPGIIIGFNRDVAWGVTNVGSDVRDFYRIRFQDANRQAYFYQGKWQAVTRRPEVIRVKGAPDVVDTVLYTHHGPVVFPDTLTGNRNSPYGMAVRWLALEPSNEVRTFLLLNRAKNYGDYEAALRTYVCPAQNFAFVSREKDIALWVNGRFPLKWKEQGKYVSDGADPRYDWQGWIPQAHNPHVKNPPRGFVSSANQQSAAPSYPYYLDWDQESFERGARINQRLAAMQGITPDSMVALQMDEYNLHAELVLPALNARLARFRLTGDAEEARRLLATWDRRNEARSIAATVFDAWDEAFTDAVFADDLPDGSPHTLPSREQVAELLLRDSANALIDDRRTPAVETLDTVLRRSFVAAVAQLRQAQGPIGQAWAWGPYKNTTVRYLFRLPGFSRELPNVGGGDNVVQASTSSHGPSWRMVVQMGPDAPTGYGVYPGGQSGNPGSRFYDNFIDAWAAGKPYRLRYLRTPELPGAKPLATLRIRPGG